MELRLSAVEFNHNPNSATDSALNIRRNFFQSVPVPEWRRGLSVRPEDSPAVYSMNDIAQDRVTIRAAFERTDPLLTTVEVAAIPTARATYPDWWPSFLVQQFLFTPPYLTNVGLAILSANLYDYYLSTLDTPVVNVLGSVAPRAVEFQADHTTGLQVFSLENVRIRELGVGARPMTWRWLYRRGPLDLWHDFDESSHKIYTVARLPTAPWTQFPFDRSNTQLPWTDVLDHACEWAAGAMTADDAAARMTESVHQLGNGLLNYNCPGGGGPNYADPVLPIFHCSEFLELLDGLRGRRYVNCTDCATIVSTFANSLGADLWQSQMRPTLPGASFIVNPVVAIGAEVFAFPCDWPAFSYHEVAWTNACTADDAVYDACVEVNSNPNGRGPIATPILPVKLRFGQVGDGLYRDMLAAPAGRLLCTPQPALRIRRSVM